MKLLELFQAPYKYEGDRHGGDFEFTFKTDDDQTFIVRFERWGIGIWICDFANVVDDRRNWKLSGKGDAPRIFSTILHILETETKKNGFKYIAFSVDKEEQTRAKLYKKLVDRYASNMGFMEVTDSNIEKFKDGEKLSDWMKSCDQYYKRSKFTLLADKKELV